MADAPAPKQLDTQAILAMLPHRHPFLMIERVSELVPGSYARGHKCVSFNEPWFQGHFPGYPILPGVLILEALAQLGGVLAHQSHTGEAPVEGVMYFLGIDKARFRKPVRPGDRLDLHVSVLQTRGTVFRFRGEASVDGERCAEAELLASAGPSL